MRGERPVHRLNSRIQSTTRGGLGQRCAKLRGVEDEKRAALAALPWRHPTHSLRTPRTYRDGSWRSCPRDDFLDGLLVSASCWWDLPPIRMARKSRRRNKQEEDRVRRRSPTPLPASVSGISRKHKAPTFKGARGGATRALPFTMATAAPTSWARKQLSASVMGGCEALNRVNACGWGNG